MVTFVNLICRNECSTSNSIQNHDAAAILLCEPNGFRVTHLNRHYLEMAWFAMEQYAVALPYFLTRGILQDHQVCPPQNYFTAKLCKTSEMVV